MKLADYAKVLDSVSLTPLICRCCGSKVSALSNVQESVCNFCEAYVSIQDKDVVHGNRNVETNLALMQDSAATGKWMDGVTPANALADTKNPYFLYGASSFYKFFSDFIYYGVDYTLGGFMYSNAEKRSDEMQKNKYNAVALISKSREFLFRALKIINDTQNPEESLLFIKFISNLKLKRKAHTKKALAEINAFPDANIMKIYANMTSSVISKSKFADKYIENCLLYGISNSLYYLALHAAMKNDIGDAIKILDSLALKSNMPLATYTGIRLRDIKNASGL